VIVLLDEQVEGEAQAGRLGQKPVNLQQLSERGILHRLTREHQLSRDLKEGLALLEVLLGDDAGALRQVGSKFDALEPLAIEPVLQQPHAELLQVVSRRAGRLHSLLLLLLPTFEFLEGCMEL